MSSNGRPAPGDVAIVMVSDISVMVSEIHDTDV